MEGGGGMGSASASHGDGAVYISLPDVASGGGATPLPGTTAGAGPSSSLVHQRATPPPAPRCSSG
jgi:hypothetical protein